MLTSIVIAAAFTLQSASPADASVAPAPDRRAVKVLESRIKIGGLGSTALVTLTLENRNTGAVKDVLIRCTNRNEGGSFVGSSTQVLPLTVAPQQVLTIRDFDMGLVHPDAARTECDVEDVVLAF